MNDCRAHLNISRECSAAFLFGQTEQPQCAQFDLSRLGLLVSMSDKKCVSEIGKLGMRLKIIIVAGFASGGGHWSVQYFAISGLYLSVTFGPHMAVYFRGAIFRRDRKGLSRVKKRFAQAFIATLDECAEAESASKIRSDGRPERTPAVGRRLPHASAPWQCLYFLPEPHGQGWLRPTLG
jgi:hypothetical protein